MLFSLIYSYPMGIRHKRKTKEFSEYQSMSTSIKTRTYRNNVQQPSQQVTYQSHSQDLCYLNMSFQNHGVIAEMQ